MEPSSRTQPLKNAQLSVCMAFRSKCFKKRIERIKSLKKLNFFKLYLLAKMTTLALK